MTSEELATAHQTWDRAWASSVEQGRWWSPEPLVEASVPLLRSRGLTRVIDVGCGIGRHAHYLAGLGFTCTGIDASLNGIAVARDHAAALGLTIHYDVAPFYELPFGDKSVDAVIAWNVIYHGNRDLAQRAIDEFARMLVPGGLLVGTMLSKRNSGFGVGREVHRDTFVVDEATDDKVHPHYYCDARTLLELYQAFEVLTLRDREQAPGAHHWEYTLERR